MTRFIAALGDPNSNSGTGAETWGLWVDDPGPRGVFLRDYDKRLAANNNVSALNINRWCLRNVNV